MNQTSSHASRWIPSLYFAEGLPYILVTTVSLILLKDLGMDNEWAIFWSYFLSFPWVLKPLWAPLLDIYGTRRGWIISMQIIMGVQLCTVGILCSGNLISGILVLFFAMAFASATHDAAVDSYYIVALDEHNQAFYSGVRSAFYKLAVLAGKGGLVMLAGVLVAKEFSASVAWMFCMLLSGGVFLILAVYHLFAVPQRQACLQPNEIADNQKNGEQEKSSSPAEHAKLSEFTYCLASFFQKKQVISAILYLLLFRFAEAQLSVAVPFMLDSRATGALAISKVSQGLLYGTWGMLALTAGGILGGLVASKQGIGRWLWPMALAINLPNLVYVYLSFALPESLWNIGTMIVIEQFGYGFGYTGFTLFMVYYAIGSGKFTTSHFALMTGLMALGMMLPGMLSGYILEHIQSWVLPFLNNSSLTKYQLFFLWVMLCTLPSFVVTGLIKQFLDPSFGIKKKE